VCRDEINCLGEIPLESLPEFIVTEGFFNLRVEVEVLTITKAVSVQR
jgi:hypothetical protein